MSADAEAGRAASLPPLRRYKRALTFLLDNLVWLILLIALACFALFIPKFFQIGIFLNILEQSTFVGIIAVGLSLTLIAGHMDLSVESVMALAAMLVALTFGTGGAGGGLALTPEWLAVPVSLAMALGAGALIGALNGLLVVRLEINAFIVTLASYIWGRGLVVALSGGRSTACRARCGWWRSSGSWAFRRWPGCSWPSTPWWRSCWPRRRSGGTST